MSELVFFAYHLKDCLEHLFPKCFHYTVDVMVPPFAFRFSMLFILFLSILATPCRFSWYMSLCERFVVATSPSLISSSSLLNTGA